MKVGKLAKYVSCFVAYIVPDIIYQWWFRRKLSRFTCKQQLQVARRVDYYCRLPQVCGIGESQGEILQALASISGPNDVSDTTTVAHFTFPWRRKHKFTLYFFDLYHTIRLFPGNLRFNYIFGDIIKDLPVPALAKTRPVTMSCSNTVLCRLDSLRHFMFIHDEIPFMEKKDMLVFRNVTDGMPWRQEFLYKYARHPLCDVGHTNHVVGIDEGLRKPFLSIGEQLRYKFIACIEGNDVATNLKWVMSSNSVAVMPRPSRESWYMEGVLIPDFHYIEIMDDYSDLEERLSYYIAHPDEAMEIVEHAHEWVAQFLDQDLESCVQYYTVQRYFKQTGQI